MTVIDLAEARKASCRRVMDLALIRFGEMSVGCVIRNLTDEGAALDVGPQSDVPDQFTLVVMTKSKSPPCYGLGFDQVRRDVCRLRYS